MQMILGVVVDAEGHPVCSEMWPGNTADVSVLLPVVDRLRGRFAIGRVCVVADRGMISAPTIAALEQRGWSTCSAPASAPTLWSGRWCWRTAGPSRRSASRGRREETQLWVKDVTPSQRYVVCRNEAEASKDAADRRRVEALDRQLKRGDKR